MMKSYIIWNISIIPPVEYVHPFGLLTSNLHNLRSETAFRIGKKAWNIKSFVNDGTWVLYGKYLLCHLNRVYKFVE